MARKVGQIISRGDRRWLIRVYLGRDHETKKRNYHNRTIHGPMREAQAYLTRKLRERDLGRDLEGAKITLNEYLDRWIQTVVKPRVREKTWQDYEGMLQRHIRPHLGERVLAAMRPLEFQTTYQKMIERGLSARTVRYTHVVLRSAIRQAVQWRLLLENPADGVKIPQQPRGEMRALTVEQAQTFLKTALATPYGPVLALALTEIAEKTGGKKNLLWQFLEVFTRKKYAAMAIGTAVVLTVVGLVESRNLKIGDLDPGAPELRRSSRYNQDNAYLTANYGASSDVLAVMVETPDQACSHFDTLRRLDTLDWRLRQLEGVETTASLALANRYGFTGYSEGSLKCLTFGAIKT